MNLLELFQLGGIVMYPLLICSILLVAVSLERAFYYLYSSTNAERLVAAIRWNLQHRGYAEALEVARKGRGPVAAVLCAGLLSVKKSDGARMDEAMETTIAREVSKLEGRLRILEVITTIAPLLGLLGTVIGIIKNFNILSQAQGLAGAAALSAGIAEALITTAVGLMIGIPSFIIYSFFDSVVDKFVVRMNGAATVLLEIYSRGGEGDELSTRKA